MDFAIILAALCATAFWRCCISCPGLAPHESASLCGILAHSTRFDNESAHLHVLVLLLLLGAGLGGSQLAVDAHDLVYELPSVLVEVGRS